ncbi:molybdopterin-binding protein [Siphonobacter sp. SORGH_AS_0500]|uniref:molybdopterin-dependent oxidoreductase n=1 Tax=Siphonobacter sp. SORGH_AS_0500 TaxID=1864824 RepID=UPI000CB866BF|nr:molybdopterin-dependent oxidoreductase [Siphonobacter sp. SORGH_AS_0500]PKK36478.1 molybdopterin-binding protein [Siphonobacter sp. SORGH_AS_0500]
MVNYVVLFWLIFSSASAQTVLKVSGEVAQPLHLQATDLKVLPHVEIKAADRDGKEHRYSGIPVIELLKKVGVTVGGQLRGENLVKYALIRAADGYEVLFALPELDPEFSNRTIILAESMDGAALPAGMGPYRIVVPEEKKPARWIREVREIEIRFAK